MNNLKGDFVEKPNFQLSDFSINLLCRKHFYLKVIDIETLRILKAIKAEGSLDKPDNLAAEAGFTFMEGISRLLYDQYSLGQGKLQGISQKGLTAFFKGRNFMQQAVTAKEQGQEKKAKQYQKQGNEQLEKAVSINPELNYAVASFRRNLNR